MISPIELERHDLIRALRKMEETLYTLWQEANIIDDHVMCEIIKELIEATVFTYECADMGLKKISFHDKGGEV